MIIDKFSERLDREKIVILIPFWQQNLNSLIEKKKVFNKIKRNISSGFGYIHYDFSIDLINDNMIETKDNFIKFLSQLRSDMTSLDKISKREFYVYAQSVGGVFGMLIADEIFIKKMVLIAPGDNLAESFWEGKATKKLKDGMERKGVNLEKLKTTWKNVSPDSSFKGKSKATEYYIKLTRNDVIIPYKHGLSLLNILDKNNVNYKLKTSFLSHPLLLLKECFFPKDSIGWLLGR